MKAVLPFMEYRFADSGLEIALGKLVLARTPYADIAGVKPLSVLPALPRPKLPSLRQIVQRVRVRLQPPLAVRRKSGWVRQLVVAPQDPAAFMTELEARVAAAKDSPPASEVKLASAG